VITIQLGWGWYVWLRSDEMYMDLLRRYLIVQALRLKFRVFWGDALICVLLVAAFCLMWRAQVVMDGLVRSPRMVHVNGSK
jgi:hypothetical protein